MAMNGINLPLAFVGQEAITMRVFMEGYNLTVCYTTGSLSSEGDRWRICRSSSLALPSCRSVSLFL